MRNRFFLGVMTLCLLGGVTSCKDEVDSFDDHGSASITSFVGPNEVNMGDSIAFDFEVKCGGIKVNQAKVQLYYGNELVSESFYTLKADGQYRGKLLAPYLKNLEDGEQKVILRVQNERFSYDSKEMIVNVKRPTFQKLTLRTDDGKEWEMLPTGVPYEYKTTISSESLTTHASIIAPTQSYGAEQSYCTANPIVFASDNGKITTGASDPIEFVAEEYDDPDGQKYDITFNTKTFKGSPYNPFGIIVMNRGEELIDFNVSGNNGVAEGELKKDDILMFSGVKKEYADLWKNPTWFDVCANDDLLLHFRGRDGKYRITLDRGLKAIMVEQMDAPSASGRLKATAMWVIGNGNIGFPSFSKNGINWTTGRAFNLCPLTATTYELIMKVGENVPSDVNFKFFGQKGWGLEWVGPGHYSISEGEELIKYAGDGNFLNNTSWPVGKYVIMTVDNATEPADLKVKILNELPLYDPNK